MVDFIAAHTTTKDITIRMVAIAARDMDEASALAEWFFYDRHHLPDGNIAIFRADQLSDVQRDDDGVPSVGGG